MEAAAKLIEYIVAMFLGNLTQTRDIVLMTLLLINRWLLALSNASVRMFHMNGRTACYYGPAEGVGDEDGRGMDRERDGGRAQRYKESSLGTVVSDFEKKEAQVVLQSTYSFNDEVNYVQGGGKRDDWTL